MNLKRQMTNHKKDRTYVKFCHITLDTKGLLGRLGSLLTLDSEVSKLIFLIGCPEN